MFNIVILFNITQIKVQSSKTLKLQLYIDYLMIDDIFLIWTGSLFELKCFYRHCNSFHKTIKFTIEYSEKQVSFLDTLVIRTEGGHILFDLFSKPTDKHCYLHYTFNHPDKHKILGLYSQFLRLKRIFTRTADLEKHASILVTFYEKELPKARNHGKPPKSMCTGP